MKEMIDIVRVLGLQVESENYLNPINISMNSNELLKKLEKYRKISIDSYWKISYLAHILRMKHVFFLCCDCLSNTKEALINYELKKSFRCYLSFQSSKLEFG